ncbi:MAG: hypothetical protein H7321_01165 [Bacteroidia bacterium]|nr:hypothetical protein [Bacteroidia bacterium]
MSQEISFSQQLFRNKKNGKIYHKLSEVTDCTNGNEDVLFVLYKLPDDDKLFIREKTEFNLKFELPSEL